MSEYEGSWSVFNPGGACIVENVTFPVAADYMTADRFYKGWTMVSVITTEAELLASHPTTSTAAGLTEAARLTDTELRAAWEACEETGYLEWAAIVQRACAEKWNVRLDGGAAK